MKSRLILTNWGLNACTLFYVNRFKSSVSQAYILLTIISLTKIYLKFGYNQLINYTEHIYCADMFQYALDIHYIDLVA